MCPAMSASPSQVDEKTSSSRECLAPEEQLKSLRENPTPWSLYILPFSAMTLIYTGVSCLPPPHQLSSSMSSLLEVSVTNVLTKEVAEVRLGVWGWCESLGDGEYCIAGRAILGYSWRDAFGCLPSIGMMGALKELAAACHGPAFMKLLGPIALAGFVGHMITFYFATSALVTQRQMLQLARRAALTKALQLRACYHTLLGIALFCSITSSVLSWTTFGLLMSLQDKAEMILSLQRQSPAFAAENTVTTQAVLGQGGWYLMVCAVTSTLPLVTIGLHFGLDALEGDNRRITLENDEDALSPSETCNLIEGTDSEISPP